MKKLILVLLLFAACKKDNLPLELNKGRNYYPVDYDSSCPQNLQPLRVVQYSAYDNMDYWENDGHNWLVQSAVDTSKYWNYWGKQLTANKSDANKKAHTTHFYWPF